MSRSIAPHRLTLGLMPSGRKGWRRDAGYSDSVAGGCVVETAVLQCCRLSDVQEERVFGI